MTALAFDENSLPTSEIIRQLDGIYNKWLATCKNNSPINADIIAAHPGCTYGLLMLLMQGMLEIDPEHLFSLANYFKDSIAGNATMA